MDAIATWAKENFQLITLLVGLVGVVVSLITVMFEVKKKKNKRKEDQGD